MPFIFDAVFENIAVLYGLPTISGSHHFVASKKLCNGQIGISTYERTTTVAR